MTEYKKIKCDRGTLIILAVIASSIVINVFFKMGFDFDYLTLSFDSVAEKSQGLNLSLLMYVLFVRLKQFLFIILLMKVLNIDIIYNTICILFGLGLGIIITVQTFYCGIYGIGELIIYMFPHFLIYIYLINMLYLLFKNFNRDYLNFGKIVFFLMLFCFGVSCEGIFSRFFLGKFFNI